MPVEINHKACTDLLADLDTAGTIDWDNLLALCNNLRETYMLGNCYRTILMQKSRAMMRRGATAYDKAECKSQQGHP